MREDDPQQALTHIEKAHELAPDNPRVVMMQATSSLFTPTMWGGDVDAAVEDLQRAADLFESDSPSGPLQPDWGHSETYAWLGIAHMKQGRYEEAESALTKALEIDPDFSWVRRVLLPKAKTGESPSPSQ